MTDDESMRERARELARRCQACGWRDAVTAEEILAFWQWKARNAARLALARARERRE